MTVRTDNTIERPNWLDRLRLWIEVLDADPAGYVHDRLNHLKLENERLAARVSALEK